MSMLLTASSRRMRLVTAPSQTAGQGLGPCSVGGAQGSSPTRNMNFGAVWRLLPGSAITNPITKLSGSSSQS